MPIALRDVSEMIPRCYSQRSYMKLEFEINQLLDDGLKVIK